jgi:hypothetical protein
MLALIKNLPIDDLETRESAWLELKGLRPEYTWIGRDYLEYDFFTEYFKNLIDKIHDMFGKSKDLIIQNRQLGHPLVAATSHRIHKDAYRNSCIVIPFSTITDPVCFYKDIDQDLNKHYKPPILMSFYSQSHAVLMDTQTPHNVLVLDKTKPRVFLQVNYDLKFNDLYDCNCMELLSKT